MNERHEYYVRVKLISNPCKQLIEEYLNLFITTYTNSFEYHFNNELTNKNINRDWEIVTLLKIK